MKQSLSVHHTKLTSFGIIYVKYQILVVPKSTTYILYYEANLLAEFVGLLWLFMHFFGVVWSSQSDLVDMSILTFLLFVRIIRTILSNEMMFKSVPRKWNNNQHQVHHTRLLSFYQILQKDPARSNHILSPSGHNHNQYDYWSKWGQSYPWRGQELLHQRHR